jgi:hypothetical protein
MHVQCQAKSSSSYATREIVLVVPLCFVATKWVALTKCPPLEQANALANELEGFMFSLYLCFYFIAYLISICLLLVLPFNCGVPPFLQQISLASFEFHHWSTKGHCN